MLAAIAFICLVGLLDYATGPGMTFTIFHLIPLAAIAWTVGLHTSLLLVLLSAVASIWGDLLTGRGLNSPALYIWNNATRWAIAVLIVVLTSKLQGALRAEQRVARTDQLTGVANRRGFEERAAAELERSRRDGVPLTVALVDVDGFKMVNDRFGHAGGDQLLARLAAALSDNTRITDVVGRLGGDEFGVLLLGLDAHRAVTLLEDLRLRVLHAAKVEGVTLSIGAITYLTVPTSVDDLMRGADELMYAVKRDGRDSLKHEVVHAGDEGSPSLLAVL